MKSFYSIEAELGGKVRIVGVTARHLGPTGGGLQGHHVHVTCSKKDLKEVCSYLKLSSSYRCEQLVDITGVDWLGESPKPKRYEVVYQRLSFRYQFRIFIYVGCASDEAVPSLTSIYSGANWQERERWDIFGVYVTDHPDLRRILTDYGFSGHPLRKDFPLSGFLEMQYSLQSKRVQYQKVILSQKYRGFSYKNPWS